MSSKILKLSTALFSVFVAHTATAEMATNNGVKGHINPYIDVTAKGGTVGKDSKEKTLKRALVRPDVFLPVYQNEDSLFALDIRGMKDFMNDQVTSMEGNFGAVYRKQVGSDSVAGFAAFFDLRRETYKGDYEANKDVGITEDVNKDFKSVTLNAHLLTSGFQLQGNLYVPLNKSNDDPIVADANVAGNVKTKTLANGDTFLLPSGLPISGLVYEANGAQGGIFQRALLGFDAYASYALPTFKNLRLGARYYNFWDHNSDGDSSEVSKSGVGANVVFQLNRYFYIEGEVNYQTDKDFAGNKSNNWHNFIGARVRIPLGGFDSELSDIDQLFTQQVRRDVDVVTGLTSKASVAADPSKIVVDGLEHTSEFKISQTAPADAAAIATSSYTEATFVNMFKDAKVKQEAGKADAANLDDATITALLAKFFPDAQDATKPAANVELKKKDDKPDLTVTVKVKAADAASASALAAVVGKSENVTYDDFKKSVLEPNYDASSKAFRAVIADSSLSYKKAFTDLDKHKTDKLAGINKDTQADLYNAVDVMTTAVKGEALAGVIDPNNTHADAAHKITTEERAKLDSSAALTRLAVLGGKADAATLLSDTITTPDTFGTVVKAADKKVDDLAKNLTEGTFTGYANNKTLDTKDKQVAALANISSDDNKKVMVAYLDAKGDKQAATVYLAGNTDPDATKAEFTLPADAADSKKRLEKIQGFMENNYNAPGVTFSNIYKAPAEFQEAVLEKKALGNVNHTYVEAITNNILSGTVGEATNEKALLKAFIAAPTTDNEKKFVGDNADQSLNLAYIDSRYGNTATINGLTNEQTNFNALIALKVNNEVPMADVVTGKALYTLGSNNTVVKGLTADQAHELNKNLRNLADANAKVAFVDLLTGDKLKLAGTAEENEVVAKNVEMYVNGSTLGKDKTALANFQALANTKIAAPVTAAQYTLFSKKWREIGSAAVPLLSASSSSLKIYSGAANGAFAEATITAPQLTTLRSIISDYPIVDGLSAADDAAQWVDFKNFAKNIVADNVASKNLRSWLALNTSPIGGDAITADQKSGLYTIGAYINDTNQKFVNAILTLSDTGCINLNTKFDSDRSNVVVNFVAAGANGKALALTGKRANDGAFAYSATTHKQYLSLLEVAYNNYKENARVNNARLNRFNKKDDLVESDVPFVTRLDDLATILDTNPGGGVELSTTHVKAILEGKLNGTDLFGGTGDTAKDLSKDLQNLIASGVEIESAANVRATVKAYLAKITDFNAIKLGNAQAAEALTLDKLTKLGTITDAAKRGKVLWAIARAETDTYWDAVTSDAAVAALDRKAYINNYLIDKFVALGADKLFAVKYADRHTITTANDNARDNTNKSGYVIRPILDSEQNSLWAYITMKGLSAYIANKNTADEATAVSDAFTKVLAGISQAATDPRVFNTYIGGTFQSKAYLNKKYTELTVDPDWDTTVAKTSGRLDAELIATNIDDVVATGVYVAAGNSRNLLDILNGGNNQEERMLDGLRETLGDADLGLKAAKHIVSVMGYTEGTKFDATADRDVLVQTIETALIGAARDKLAAKAAANVLSTDLLPATQVKNYRKAMLGCGDAALNIIQVATLYNKVGTAGGGTIGNDTTTTQAKLAYQALFGNGTLAMTTNAGASTIFAADDANYTEQDRVNLVQAVAGKDVNWTVLKDSTAVDTTVKDDALLITATELYKFFDVLNSTGSTVASAAKDVLAVNNLLSKQGGISGLADGEHRQLLASVVRTFTYAASGRFGDADNASLVNFNANVRPYFNSVTKHTIWDDTLKNALFGTTVFSAGSAHGATSAAKDADAASKTYSSMGRLALFGAIFRPGVTHAVIAAVSPKFGINVIDTTPANATYGGAVDAAATTLMQDKIAAAVAGLNAAKANATPAIADAFKSFARGDDLVNGARISRTQDELDRAMFFVVDSAGVAGGLKATFYSAADTDTVALNNARVSNVVLHTFDIAPRQLKKILYCSDDTGNNVAHQAGDALLTKDGAGAAAAITGYDYRILGAFLESSNKAALINKGVQRIAADAGAASADNKLILASLVGLESNTANYWYGDGFNTSKAAYDAVDDEVAEYSKYAATWLMISDDIVTEGAYDSTRPLAVLTRIRAAYNGVGTAGRYTGAGAGALDTANTDNAATDANAIADYVAVDNTVTNGAKLFVHRSTGKLFTDGALANAPIYHPLYSALIAANGEVVNEALLMKVVAANFTDLTVDWSADATTMRSALNTTAFNFKTHGIANATLANNGAIVGSLDAATFIVDLDKTIGSTSIQPATPGTYLVGGVVDAGTVTTRKGGVLGAGGAAANTDATVAAEFLVGNLVGANAGQKADSKARAKLVAYIASQLINQASGYKA